MQLSLRTCPLSHPFCPWPCPCHRQPCLWKSPSRFALANLACRGRLLTPFAVSLPGGIPAGIFSAPWVRASITSVILAATIQASTLCSVEAMMSEFAIDTFFAKSRRPMAACRGPSRDGAGHPANRWRLHRSWRRRWLRFLELQGRNSLFLSLLDLVLSGLLILRER